MTPNPQIARNNSYVKIGYHELTP